jgi:hypothetical protein
MKGKKSPTKRETAIVVTKDSVAAPDSPISLYPSCVLPPSFFERAQLVVPKDPFSAPIVHKTPRSLLSVSTWDGREVVSFEIE